MPIVFIAPVSAFSLTPWFAPDSIVSIFGAGFAAGPAAATKPLPTTLGDLSVAVIDAAGESHPATLYYVSERHVNAVIAAGTPLGPARLTVTSPGGRFLVAIEITAVAPALASADGSGSGPAAALLLRVRADGSQETTAITGPVAFDGDRLYLILYGSGLRNARQLSCTLNGSPAKLLYGGSQGGYPGLDQVNVELAPDLRDVVSIQCAADGRPSNIVTITLL